MQNISPEQKMKARMMRELAADRVQIVHNIVQRIHKERGEEAEYTPTEYQKMAHEMGFVLMLLLTAVCVYLDPMDDMGPVGVLPPKDRMN